MVLEKTAERLLDCKEIIKKSGDRTESSIVSFAERILEPSLISMAVAKWSITASKRGNNGVKCKCYSLSCVQVFATVDCSLPGSSVHGILQARILEWVAIPFSRGSSQPRDQTWVSCIAGRFFTI